MNTQQTLYRQQYLQYGGKSVGLLILTLVLAALSWLSANDVAISGLDGVASFYKTFTQHAYFEWLLIGLSILMAVLHMKQWWFYRQLLKQPS